MQRFGLLSLTAACLAAVAGTPAQAAFRVRITDLSNGETLTVTDNTAGADTDAAVDAITIDPDLIDSTFTNLGDGSTLSSTFLTTVLPTLETSELTRRAQLVRAGTGDVQFLVESTRTDVFVPADMSKTLQDSAGATFTNTPVGDSIEFEGWADPANGEFAMGVSAGPILLVNDTFPGSRTLSGNNPAIPFVDDNPFSLTSATLFSASAGANIQSVNSVVVFARPLVVPTPAGLVLAAAAVPAFGLRRALRRKAG